MNRSNEDRERVRDASDIVRVVGEHVSLKAKGREWAGLCPFHDDHRPSMNVIPGKQIFHCFVCGAGGDVFSFVQKYHKMEFREALEYLAERAGIELTRFQTPLSEGQAPPSSRSDLVKANAAAAEYFRALLRHPEHGRAAREVIERRAISPEMQEEFGLGASADRWDGLVLTAEKRGLSMDLMAAAGLLKRKETGYYDSFRNRLMFPILDEAGRVIAFGGRKINEADEPKYLNSAESKVFEKSSTLYGLHQASRSIQAERTAIITEGYTDTIACHQAGITNAVATLGTALTTGHAARLRRYCDTVVLLFDGDEAGQRAADRAVEVFIRESLDVKIATLAGVTDAKDPDELLKREGGTDVLRRAIAQATDLLEYRYVRLRAALGTETGPAALSRIVEEELDKLVQIGLNELSPVRRRLILKQLASIAGIDEVSLGRMVPAGRDAARSREAFVGATRPARPKLDEFLGCLLLDPRGWRELEPEVLSAVAPGRFEDPETRRVALAVDRVVQATGSCGLDDLLTALDDDTDAKAEAVAIVECVRQAYGDDALRTTAFEDMRREYRRAGAPAGKDFLTTSRAREQALGANRRVVPRPTLAG